MAKKRLGDLLVESAILTQEQLEQALELQKQSKHKLGDVLFQNGFVSETQLIEVLEFQLGIPHINLSRYEVDPTLTQIISESLAKRYQVVPVKKKDRKLVVAMVDPLDYFAIEDLRMQTGFTIEPAILTRGELARAISNLYGIQNSMNEMLEELNIDQDVIDESEITDEDSPVVRLVNQMILQAVQLRASDIHVDPMEQHVIIRYRIDGILRNERTLPKNMQGVITARLKIMANLNIAERRTPQDGRMKMTFDIRTIDIRIATIPTVHGEKLVLRLLDLTQGTKGIDQLGFSERNHDRFRRMLDSSFGMILITGPTGSGKTTTLYSALNHLNKEDVNIITIEDPVEYQIEGINQVQINTVTGLTFSNGLRSILRQDPNIIMVGEIRDLETTEIAIRSSLTGHQVFSTLHTNNAISSIVRLMDMGVEPYLIASSLVGIVAQRLVRRICPDCKEKYTPSEQEKIILEQHQISLDSLYSGSGCGSCNRTGYRGRMSIHEVLWIDDELRKLIIHKAPAADIRQHAKTAGLVPIMEDGLSKVAQGITTLQEIMRETAIDE